MEEHESNMEVAVGGVAKVIVVMLSWKLFLSSLVSSGREEGNFSLHARDLRSSG
jgi:hypothetical protein